MDTTQDVPPVNLYTTTIPPFIRAMTNLIDILAKAEEHSTSQKIPPAYYLNARLFPDMKDLIFQVQRVSDTAKFVLVRVCDQEPVKMEDNEASFADLKARMEKTIEVLKKVSPEDLAGLAPDKEVVYTRANGWTWKSNPYTYISMFAMPNFYFHLTSAYGILRHCGVPVGKDDFLGTHRI